MKKNMVRYDAPDGANFALTIEPISASVNTPLSIAISISSSVRLASSKDFLASSTVMSPLATPRSSFVIVSSIIDHLFALSYIAT